MKWGILSTSAIPKNLVEDYIYYKLQFENMIEGSEELKAYIYEASHFQRVDTIMEEGGSYHAVYMPSSEFSNWTRTHGGPFYAEVGKNIEVQYHVKVNVTKKSTTAGVGNNTNATAVATYTTEEEDQLRSWIYYEYDPSSVEYYYYKDCVVKDMQPHSGLVVGGTPVAVVGAWFKYMPEYGVVPHCKFGDKIVRA